MKRAKESGQQRGSTDEKVTSATVAFVTAENITSIGFILLIYEIGVLKGSIHHNYD